jgi:hypothetical protein
MKKILAVLICMLMLMGCAALKPSPTIVQTAGKLSQVAIDLAFYNRLQTNPADKADIVKGLNTIKLFLNATSCTYNELIVEIAKQFPAKYSGYAIVVSYYFDCDVANSTSLIPLLDPYKEGLNKKIDRLLTLTELIK